MPGSYRLQAATATYRSRTCTLVVCTITTAEMQEEADVKEIAYTSYEDEKYDDHYITIEKGPQRRFHFYPKDDILLLREVLEQRAYAAPFGQIEESWKVIADTLRERGMNCEVRTLRERFSLLLRKHLEGVQGGSLQVRRLGTSAEHEQITALLNEISSERTAMRSRKSDTRQIHGANLSGVSMRKRRRMHGSDFGDGVESDPDTWLVDADGEVLLDSVPSARAQAALAEIVADALDRSALMTERERLRNRLVKTQAQRESLATNVTQTDTTNCEALHRAAEQARLQMQSLIAFVRSRVA